MLSKNEVKYIQSLRQKKSRQQSGCFVAEGPKIVEELVDEKPKDIQHIYATADWLARFRGIEKHFPVKEIEASELQKISFLETPQQVLAVVKTQPHQFLPFQKKNWMLMLDGIQDPGNMGSIIRIADWFGISNIYCNHQTADCYNPKVVQAAMGSLWRVNICYGPCAQWLANADFPVYGALLDGDDILKYGLKPDTGMLVIGSEGKGIGTELMPFITNKITIPKLGKAESLNAAVATGIILAIITQGH